MEEIDKLLTALIAAIDALAKATEARLDNSWFGKLAIEDLIIEGSYRELELEIPLDSPEISLWQDQGKRWDRLTKRFLEYLNSEHITPITGHPIQNMAKELIKKIYQANKQEAESLARTSIKGNPPYSPVYQLLKAKVETFKIKANALLYKQQAIDFTLRDTLPDSPDPIRPE